MYLNFTPVPRAVLAGTEPRYRVEDLGDFLKSVLTGCPSSCHISADHLAALEDGAVLAEWFPDDTPEVQETVEEVHAEMTAVIRKDAVTLLTIFYRMKNGTLATRHIDYLASMTWDECRTAALADILGQPNAEVAELIRFVPGRPRLCWAWEAV